MTAGFPTRVGLLARTVAHLEPHQVAHRARLRGQRKLLEVVPPRWSERLFSDGDGPGEAVGWPSSFVSVGRQVPAGSPNAAANAGFRFEFLDHSRDIGDPPDWHQLGADQLWRYHLHYFEWAWAFLGHPDRSWAQTAFAKLWRSWRAGTTFGHWEEWSPYVASLRAWVLCDVFDDLVAGTDIEDDVLASLRSHWGFLRRHQEKDVGGNHLLKNLKALAALGVFFRHSTTTTAALAAADRQLALQVLPDGGHFELSPSYHCQVLADMVDLVGLATASGQPVPDHWQDTMGRMRRWLGAILLADGTLPRFNDSEALDPRLLALLDPMIPGPGLHLYASSGYAAFRGTGAISAVFDVGDPCPRTLPAHAHADCLSLEVTAGGRPLLVNSGTSTYAPGRRRQYERSTGAHNTAEIDGADQTEVWGSFRAARRAHAVVHEIVDGDEMLVRASHDGYRRLPGSPVHERSVRLSGDDLVVDDLITGDGRHEARITWHCAPGVRAQRVESNRIAVGQMELVADANGPQPIEMLAPGTGDGSWVAEGFGQLRPAWTLTVLLGGELPLRCRTSVTLRGP